MNPSKTLKPLNRAHSVLILFSSVLGSADILAASGGSGLNYSVSPTFFNTELIAKSEDELKEARLNSSLGISLSGSDFFQLSMNYKMLGRLENAKAPISSIDQILNASVQSNVLDNLFNIKAGIRANSIVRRGGENYSYKVTPGFSKSIHDFAKLNVKYNFELTKPSQYKSVKETRGYSLGLKGQLDFGNIHWNSVYSQASVFQELLDESKGVRDVTVKLDGKLNQDALSWTGVYSKSSIENDVLTPAEDTEVIKIQSRYRIVPQMHLELSSSKKRKTLLSSLDQRTGNEIHHAAGITWSPSTDYSLAFNVNKFDSTELHQEDYYSSGKIVWFPQSNLEMSFGYGDKLLKDSRGLVINATLDLDNRKGFHPK